MPSKTVRARLAPASALLLLAGLAGGAAAEGSRGFHAAPFDGSKRLVLVFADDAADPRLKAERRQLQALTRAPDDRDLVVIEIAGTAAAPPFASAEALRRRFAPPQSAFAVLLVGKDGGVKICSNRLLAADALRRAIDAMPMRRAERRRSGDAGA